MKKWPLLFCILSITAACDRSAQDPAGAAAGGGGAAPVSGAAKEPMDTPSIANAFGAALAMPRFASDNAQSSRSMLVEAVYFATGQTGSGQFGQITSTGTVQVSELGAVYSPAPTDKLIIQLGAQTHEFKLKNAQGNNNAATALSWILSPHVLEYTHTMPNQAEANLSVQFDGNNFSARISGWAMLGSQRYEVDLTAQGTSSGSSDGTGAERQTQYRMTGTIRGGGADVTVLEEHTVSFASAIGLNLLASQRGNATQIRSVSSSSVKIGGDIYKFNNIQAESGMKERGNQSSGGMVSAAGLVTKNDAPFGEVMLQNGAVVVAAGGNVIPLRLGN